MEILAPPHFQRKEKVMNLPGFTAEESLVRSARVYSQRYSFGGFAPRQSASPMSARLSLASALSNFWFRGGAGSRSAVSEIDVLFAPGAGACYCASCVFGPSCTSYLAPSCDPALLDWWCGSWIAIGCPSGYHPCMNYRLQELRCCANAPMGPDYFSK
jgi:hypothetical protein